MFTKTKTPAEANLLNLIQCCNWRKLSRALKSKDAKTLMRRQRDDTNLTCLALALGYHAPIKIIEQMIDLDPDMAYEKDSFGETALHLACLNGSAIEEVSMLLDNHQDLVYEVDLDLRVALHHAVEYFCEREALEDGTNETYMDVIQILCEAAPDTLYSFDKTGATPIDIVQSTKLKYDNSSLMYEKLENIYCELTSLSVKYYIEKKKGWEMEGYMTQLCLTGKDEPNCASVDTTTVSSQITPNSISVDTTASTDMCRVNRRTEN